MAGEVCRASNCGPAPHSPDPEMAEGGGVGRRGVEGDEGRDATRGSSIAFAGKHLSALCLRSLGEPVAAEVGARGHDRGPLRRRCRVGFEHRKEAEAFLEQLRERMQKFGLELHPEKTRLIEFGRFAEDNRKRRGEGKPETFDFLGFTHSCEKTRKDGRFKVQRRTIKKRWRSKLQAVK